MFCEYLFINEWTQPVKQQRLKALLYRSSNFQPRLDMMIFLVALTILYSHISSQGGLDWLKHQLDPVRAYSLSFISDFEADDSEVNIYTYYPADTARQQIIEQSSYGHVNTKIEQTQHGDLIHWRAAPHTKQTKYSVKLITSPLEFELDHDLEIPKHYPDRALRRYLEPSETIQVNHPEIKEIWDNLKPNTSRNTYAVLKAIYNYTHRGLESVPFKGQTDALTAGRLGIASCNGKSRLFVALARLNNLPSRLVGGVILDNGEKRTSHQWVEVWVQNHWIPFGPTNGHFAALPAHYLRLYTGDQVLIRHTSNINFDYHFDIQEELISPTFYKQIEGLDFTQSQLTSSLREMNISPKTIGIVLLFPICSLLITFLRNVVGLKTFGIFMPMLIAASCYYTGLLNGAIGFSALLVFAWLVYWLADRLHLLKTARLAIVITSVIGASLSLILWADNLIPFEVSGLSVFPVVIISFIAERLNQSMGDEQWQDTLISILGTITSIVLCYALLQSMMLKNIFAIFPEMFLVILAAQIYLGKWSGIRVSELWRFRQLLNTSAGEVLGINGRNRDIIYRHNTKQFLRLAADKLAAKDAMTALNVPVPKTLLTMKNHADIVNLSDCINRHTCFALKPNKGSQGKGILVIRGKKDGVWLGSGGKKWSLKALEDHVSEILSGSYSQSGDSDLAYIEPLLTQDAILQDIAPDGLCDIRIVVAKGKAVTCMLRMPTKLSGGKANLHQGAIGVALDLMTGKSVAARHHGKEITTHPDTGMNLLQISIPNWASIIEISERCYQAVPLAYLGVDVCIDNVKGALILEVNGRPGLEIQNITNRGFYHDLVAKIETA
jgi:alpha-L-glutamate ligase-like protein